MKSTARSIAKFFRSGFKSDGLNVEKFIYTHEGKQYVGYVIYQNSTFLWMSAKDKLVSCPDIEDLREINKRCELGLDI